MDPKELTRKLKAGTPEGAILELRPFGRSSVSTVYVETKSLLTVARFLRDEPAFSLDWLENLSAMEVQNAVVLSYFLRSRGAGGLLVLRASLLPASAEAEVDCDSVTPVWPMAERMEREIADLFGVRFRGNPMVAREALPSDWVGYPLRKGYFYPTESQGIPHMRPAGHTGPDEYGVHS